MRKLKCFGCFAVIISFVCLLTSCFYNSGQDEIKSDGLSEKENICILSVRCDDAIGKIPASKESVIPEDGIILPETEIEFEKGETVFDVLLREMKKNKIHMDFAKTSGTGGVYIKGISNLYELDCGEFSGWSYVVNGEMPQYSCDEIKLSHGDKIEFFYLSDFTENMDEN